VEELFKQIAEMVAVGVKGAAALIIAYRTIEAVTARCVPWQKTFQVRPSQEHLDAVCGMAAIGFGV
jgi:hypothetical protein